MDKRKLDLRVINSKFNLIFYEVKLVTLDEITITVTEVVLTQVFFLTVGSKHKKIKIKT